MDQLVPRALLDPLAQTANQDTTDLLVQLVLRVTMESLVPPDQPDTLERQEQLVTMVKKENPVLLVQLGLRVPTAQPENKVTLAQQEKPEQQVTQAPLDLPALMDTLVPLVLPEKMVPQVTQEKRVMMGPPVLLVLKEALAKLVPLDPPVLKEVLVFKERLVLLVIPA